MPATPVTDDETILFNLDEVKEAEKKAEKKAEDTDSQNLNAAIEAAMKQLNESGTGNSECGAPGWRRPQRKSRSQEEIAEATRK